MVGQLPDKNFNQWSWIIEELDNLKKASLYRSLKTAEPIKDGKLYCSGRELLNLCSNNYLGLSEDLDFTSIHARDNATLGATASRLVTGNHPSFNELEMTIAKLKNSESSLIFSCGYMANIGIITALVGRNDAVYSDRLNHASLIDGIMLSGAKHFRYRHNDPGHLTYLLKNDNRIYKKLIITESLFSMDGDLAFLEELVEIKDRFEAKIMVDEAHSGGIYGAKGAGLVQELGLSDRVDIQMGTFSKAYGCFGAYVAGSKVLIDYLINKARSFILTTGLPPIINYLNLQAVNLCIRDDWRRRQLFENAEFFREGLTKMGLNIGKSVSYIIPLIIGEERQALELSEILWREGIAAIAIRPPTVPKNTARIRFSIMATHKKSDLERTLNIIKKSVKRINF